MSDTFEKRWMTDKAYDEEFDRICNSINVEDLKLERPPKRAKLIETIEPKKVGKGKGTEEDPIDVEEEDSDDDSLNEDVLLCDLDKEIIKQGLGHKHGIAKNPWEKPCCKPSKPTREVTIGDVFRGEHEHTWYTLETLFEDLVGPLYLWPKKNTQVLGPNKEFPERKVRFTIQVFLLVNAVDPKLIWEWQAKKWPEEATAKKYKDFCDVVKGWKGGKYKSWNMAWETYTV